jgi:hypothetical protein
MNAPRVEESSSAFPSAAALGPALSSEIPWHQAQDFLREIEAQLGS